MKLTEYGIYFTKQISPTSIFEETGFTRFGSIFVHGEYFAMLNRHGFIRGSCKMPLSANDVIISKLIDFARTYKDHKDCDSTLCKYILRYYETK